MGRAQDHQSARREELAAKFAARSEAREQERQRRLEAARVDEDPNESTERFTGEFYRSLEAVRGRMRELGAHSSPASEIVLLKTECRDMELMLADASRFLTGYDAKQAQDSVVALRSEIEDAQDQHVPRRRFKFRSRAAVEERRRKAHGGAGGENAPANGGAGCIEAKAKGRAAATAFEANETAIADRRGEAVAVRPGDLAKDGGSADARLSDLEDCVVSLCDTLSALHAVRLRRCHVYVGAVAGSVMVDQCTDCVFMVASRQIRIHTSERCDFYLRVRSNPIIEHCREVRFAPFALAYLQLQEQQQAAGLDSCEEGMWRRVNDFNWHRVQQSPNWSVVPPSERAASARDPELRIGGGDADRDVVLTRGGPPARAARSRLSPAGANEEAPEAAGSGPPGAGRGAAGEDSDDEL